MRLFPHRQNAHEGQDGRARMRRRAVIVLGGAAFGALGVAMLPTHASAVGTAKLTSNLIVLPGDRPFSIEVKNNEPPALVAGVGTVKSVDFVRIVLPSADAGIFTKGGAVPTKPGWNSYLVSDGFTQFIDFKTTTAAIAPGGTTTFDFVADVRRPLNRDRTGEFGVGLSSDGGDTIMPASVAGGGSLAQAVKVLEVTALRVSAPTLAADTTGTAGQGVTFETSVTNHSRSNLLVTPKVASSNGTDVIGSTGNGTGTPGTVAALGGTTTFNIPATLGTAASDRATTFTGSATATNAATTSFLDRTFGYTVQPAPNLSVLTGTLSPVNVQHAPRSYTFAVDVRKLSTPTFSITGGGLQFKNKLTGTMVSQVIALPPGDVSFADGTARRLTYTAASLSATLTDGSYHALFTFAPGPDGNGFTPSAATLDRTLEDALNLDNVAPRITVEVELPNDRDAVRTTRARDYKVTEDNKITVKGTIDDATSTRGPVELQHLDASGNPTGATTPVESITQTTVGGTVNFTGTAKPTFAANVATFRPTASATDPAENTGRQDNATTLLTQVDNHLPRLFPTGDVLLDPRFVVEVDGQAMEPRPVIAVRWDENFALIGGCQASAYTVEGERLVLDVRYSDSTKCVNGQAGPSDNIRVLVLAQEIERRGEVAEPLVTYNPDATPVGGDDAKDAAGAYTPLSQQDTLNKLVPEAPRIVRVTRNGDAEDAVSDEGFYWTRFAGSDLLVRVSDGLLGDELEVTNASGTVLATAPVINNDGTGQINVPLGTVDGAKNLRLRFRSARNVAGNLTELKAQLDRVAPGGTSAVRTAGTNQVAFTFTEKVLGGNQAANWTVFELVEDEDGSLVQRTRIVASVTGSDLTRERTLTANFSSATSTFGGVKYLHLNGRRYEDRAGNTIASPTTQSGTTTSAA